MTNENPIIIADLIRKVKRQDESIRALETELEGVNASHDDEEAAHQDTLRLLKISQEQVKEYEQTLDGREWRTVSDAKFIAELSDRIKAMAKE